VRADRIYASFMGVGSKRLLAAEAGAARVRLADILYYAYHKGFWAYLRGWLYRPRLRRCGGRLFVGRGARILFPSHLGVGHNVAIGDFTYVTCFGTEGVELGHNVRIREFGWVQVTSHLSHPGRGLRIGDDTYIGPHCVLGAGGGIVLGKHVMLGAYVQLLAEDHAFSDPSQPIDRQGVTRRGITVGDGCWLGNSVIVLDGVHIGEGTVVGAGSVVTRDLPQRSVAVGNPARVIKERAA